MDKPKASSSVLSEVVLAGTWTRIPLAGSANVEAILSSDVSDASTGVTVESFSAELEPLTDQWEHGPLAAPPAAPAAMVAGPCLFVPTPEVESWRHGDLGGGEGFGAFDAEASAVLEDVVSRAGPLGRASSVELRSRVQRALRWASASYIEARGPFTVFARSVASLATRRMVSDIGWQWLRLELVDEKRRDAARRCEKDLAPYLGWVKKALTRIERSRRRGGRPEDIESLVDDTVVEVLSLLRSEDSDPFARFERPGRPAFLQVVNHVRARHRREQRVHLVENVVSVVDVASPAPTPEQILLGAEAEPEAAAWVARVNARATKKQRDWLAAFQAAAVDADAHGLCARAARVRGVHRSQAGRALVRLTELFHQAAPEADVRQPPRAPRPAPAPGETVDPTATPSGGDDLHIVLKRQSQANRLRRFARPVRLAAVVAPPDPSALAHAPPEELAAVLKKTSRLNRRRKFQRPCAPRPAPSSPPVPRRTNE